MYTKPSRLYKLRKIVTNNEDGDVYGVTMPSEISKKYSDIFFTITESGNAIVLESGCKIHKQHTTHEVYWRETIWKNN